MKYLNSVVLLGITLTICMTPVVFADPLNWSSPVSVTLDPTESMDLRGGPDGNFHMLVSQSAADSIYYFRYETSAYTQLVDSFTNPDTMLCALDFWGNMPVGVYRHHENQDIEFSLRTSTWTTASPIDNTASCYALKTAVETSGVIHLAWVFQDQYQNCSLIHSYSSGSSWINELVFTMSENEEARLMDMKLDSDDVPHFIWHDKVYDVIGYAKRTGVAAFEFDIVDPSVDSCRWLELEFLDPDVPFVGYVTGSSVPNATLNYALKLGYFSAGVVLESVGIYAAEMAIDPSETITSTRIYFIVTLSSGVYTLRQAGTEWEMERISELYSVSTNVNLSADWCASTDTLGVAISDFGEDDMYFLTAQPYQPTPTATPNIPTATPGNPTATPTPSGPTATPGNPTATPTPGNPTPTSTPGDCSELGCTIDMPSNEFHPGDRFYCNVNLCNPGPDTYENIPLFVILDVYGTFYFAPTFNAYDHYALTLNIGEQTQVVIAEFPWPSGTGSATGIHFYAGLTDHAISELLGNYDMFTFGWSE